MLSVQIDCDIPPFVTRAPATGIDKAGPSAWRSIDDHCDAAHTRRGFLPSISHPSSNSWVGSEAMDSRSIGLITGDRGADRTVAAIPNDGLSGRVSIEKPFKAAFKAMQRIGDDFAQAQEMARQAQKKSPRLGE
jgi:hypothetical protein